MREFLLVFSLLFAALPVQAITPAPVQGGSPAPIRPVVAVIDSGVARTAELAPALVAEYDMATAPGRTPFRPRYDHGTMVATILVREARQPVGIISFRIDDPAGCPAGANPPCQPSAAPLEKAIREATRLGVDAINISLALKDDRSISAAIRDAAAQGILVVLAAGNDGLDRPGNLDMATAGFPNTILVGALDDKGQPWSGTNRPGRGAGTYNYAWQWGVAVPTLTAAGASARATGTSFAAPIETARLLACGKAKVVQETIAERCRNLMTRISTPA